MRGVEHLVCRATTTRTSPNQAGSSGVTTVTAAARLEWEPRPATWSFLSGRGKRLMTAERARAPATSTTGVAAETTLPLVVRADLAELITRISVVDGTLVSIERAYHRRRIRGADPDVFAASAAGLTAAVALGVVADGARVGRVGEGAWRRAVCALLDVRQLGRAHRAPHPARGADRLREAGATRRDDRQEQTDGRDTEDDGATAHGSRDGTPLRGSVRAQRFESFSSASRKRSATARTNAPIQGLRSSSRSRDSRVTTFTVT